MDLSDDIIDLRSLFGVEEDRIGDVRSSFEDRISDLPNSLIHHILSFIDMKYAVRTCVLSKRWSQVWISLPFLNFDSSLYMAVRYGMKSMPRRKGFDLADFMKMVFFLRDNSDIMRFRLFLDESFSEDPDTLILAAVRHNVRELDIEIDLSVCDFYQLPRHVFSCKSLRKLKLKTSNSEDAESDECPEFNVPESVSLHQLNSLILEGFVIPSIESLNSLCSSCPLREMRITHCHIGNESDYLNFTVDSAYLQALELDWVLAPDGSVIELNAPNIASFICKDVMEQEYSLGNLSSLVTADITMSLYENEKDETASSYLDLSREEEGIYGKRIIDFLGAIDNVKDLKLSSGFLEVLSKALGQLDCQPLQFCNLQHLELTVWFTRGSMQATIYLLRISPNLKSIVLASKESGLPDIGENWEVGPSLPCTISKLSHVEIREVEGCDNELKLLGFLLENAVVLDEVALFFRSTVGSPDRMRQVKRFRDQLRALPKASSSASIFAF